MLLHSLFSVLSVLRVCVAKTCSTSSFFEYQVLQMHRESMYESHRRQSSYQAVLNAADQWHEQSPDPDDTYLQFNSNSPQFSLMHPSVFEQFHPVPSSLFSSERYDPSLQTLNPDSGLFYYLSVILQKPEVKSLHGLNADRYRVNQFCLLLDERHGV